MVAKSNPDEPLIIWDDLSDIEPDAESVKAWMKQIDERLERRGLQRVTRRLANGNTITSIRPKDDA